MLFSCSLSSPPDGPSLCPRSLVRWPSSEALLSWPDLLSDPSIMGNTIQKLKRGRASRHLGLEAPLAAEDDSLSLGVHQGQPRYFSASGGCARRIVRIQGLNAPGMGRMSSWGPGNSALEKAEGQNLLPSPWLQWERQRRREGCVFFMGISAWEGRNAAVGQSAASGHRVGRPVARRGRFPRGLNVASEQHFCTSCKSTVEL